MMVSFHSDGGQVHARHGGQVHAHHGGPFSSRALVSYKQYIYGNLIYSFIYLNLF